MIRRRVGLLAAALIGTVGTHGLARAQSYTTVHEFTGGGDGAIPNTSLTFDAAGNGYGGTETGADACGAVGAPTMGCGTIYKIDPRGNLTTLVTFNGTNGAVAGTDLLLVGNTLYGGTVRGGPNYAGLLFSVNTDGSNYTILHQFTGKDGAFPTGQLIGTPGGGVYGITSGGSTDYPKGSYGVLYTATPGGDVIPLHYFRGTDGVSPNAIILHDGVIYGSTEFGGCGTTNHCGTVFSYTLATGVFSTLQVFTSRDGEFPMLGAVDDHGVLYGTTEIEGPRSGDEGTLFEMTPGANGAYTLTDLAVFDQKNGSNPISAPLLTPAGQLIGTTLADYGDTVPSLYLYDSQVVGNILPLVQFPGYSTNVPVEPTTQAAVSPSDIIYGTGRTGGLASCIPLGYPSGCGIVYSFPAAGGPAAGYQAR